MKVSGNSHNIEGDKSLYFVVCPWNCVHNFKVNNSLPEEKTCLWNRDEFLLLNFSLCQVTESSIHRQRLYLLFIFVSTKFLSLSLNNYKSLQLFYYLVLNLNKLYYLPCFLFSTRLLKDCETQYFLFQTVSYNIIIKSVVYVYVQHEP